MYLHIIVRGDRTICLKINVDKLTHESHDKQRYAILMIVVFTLKNRFTTIIDALHEEIRLRIQKFVDQNYSREKQKKKILGREFKVQEIYT